MSGSTSYSVSARLNIGGNYQQVMRQLGSSLTGLNRQIGATEARVARLAGLFPSLATVIGTSSAAASNHLAGLRNAVTGVSGVVQASTRSLNSQTAAFNRNNAAALRATASAQGLAAQMRALASIPPPPRIPAAPRSSGGGGGVNVVGGSLRAVGAAVTARAAGSGVMGMLNAAGETQTLETLMAAQQVPAGQRAQLRAAIGGWIERAPGATIADAMQAFSEARQAVGDQNGTNIGPALEVAPLLLRAARLAGVLGKRDTAEGLRPLARFMAIRGSFTNDQGQLDSRQGADELRAMESALLAFTTARGEGVPPREFENLAKQMGVAGRRMSIEGIMGAVTSLMQEVGGHRAGTMLSAFADQVVSGTVKDETRGRMGRIGLLQAPGVRGVREARAQEDALLTRLVAEGKMTQAEADTARARGRTTLPSGAAPVVGRGLAATRPDLWMQEHFASVARADIARRQGIRPEAVTEDQILDLFDSLGFRATNRRFGATMLQTREVQSDISNQQRIEAARRRGEDPAGQFLRQSYAGALENLTGSFTILLEQIGRSPAIIGLFNDMARGLRELGDAVQDREWVDSIVRDISRFQTQIRATAEEFRRIIAAVDGVVSWFQTNRDRLHAGATGFIAEVDRVVAFVDSLPGRLAALPGQLWRSFREQLGGGAASPPTPGGPPAGPAMPPGGLLRLPPIPGLAPRGGLPEMPRIGALPMGFSPIPPTGDPLVVRVPVILDGRVLTEVVARGMGRAAQAPTASARGYDPRRGGPRPTTI